MNNKNNNKVVDMAINLTEIGVSVVPVNKIKKNPIGQWKKYQKEMRSVAEIQDEFIRHKNCNVGILTGQLSNIIVIDADSLEAVEYLEDKFNLCSKTPLIISSGRIDSKGLHYYFSYPKDSKLSIGEDILKARLNNHNIKIDYRGEGGMIIFPPSVHESGKSYSFEKLAVDLRDIKKLPELPQEVIKFLKPSKEKTDVKQENIFEAKPKEKKDTDFFIDLSKIEEYEEKPDGKKIIEECGFLQHCVDDRKTLSQTDWYFGLLSILSRCEDGKDLCLEYSKDYDGFSRREFEKQFNHAINDALPTTCDTIKEKCGDFYCKDCLKNINSPIALGYEPKESIPEVPEFKEIPQILFKGDEEIPEYLLKPGGVMNDLMILLETNSAACHPWFNLGGVLTYMGSLLGAKVETETGLRTNFYSLIIGNSGTGKNAPSVLRKVNKKCGFQKSDSIFDSLYITKSITSGAAIYTMLKNNRRSLVMYDEFTHFLKRGKNSDNDFFEVMKTCYSQIDEDIDKNMADEKRKLDFEWFFLSFIGQTTPDDFWDVIKEKDINDGFLPRFLFFESEHEKPLPKSKISKKIPENIINALQSINRIKPLIEEGSSLDDPVPEPFLVERTDEALELYEEYKLKHHNSSIQAFRKGNKTESAFYNRTLESIDKIALIVEISKRLPLEDDIEDVKISLDSMKYACRLIDFMIKRTIAKVRSFVYESENEQMQKKILAILDRKSSYKKPAIKRSQLIAASRSWTTKTFDSFINTLIEREDVGIVNLKNKNNLNVRYYFLPKYSEQIKRDLKK